MTIRQRITLLIAGAGLFASLLFSAAVFLELVEQPFQILDKELKEAAHRLAREKIVEQKKMMALSQFPVYENNDLYYWLRISDSVSKETVYESDLARHVALPSLVTGGRTIVFAVVSTEKDRPGQKTAFRVRTVETEVEGKKFTVQIGRSMEKLIPEIEELLMGLLAGFVFSTIALIIISFFIAGKILKPIRELNESASLINEKNLQQRIPEGPGRDEFTELTRTINGMLDRLQFSFAKQKRYVADASHELKSPIAMLRLFFEEAAQRSDLPEAFQQQMDNQRLNMLRIDRLVKTLMELSVLELKTVLTREFFDLVDLGKSVLEDFAPLIERANLRVETGFSSDMMMQGDSDQIRRVLINLLDNAVKYNVDGGIIRLTFSEKSGAIRLSLYNTGPGIPAEDLPKVFDQFYRVEKSRSKEYGGVGLGLSIVQEIVRLHRGTISIDSEPGAWTLVTISFSPMEDSLAGKAEV
ncbi:MAG: ATP-binding protein [Pseudomonadota bacterium]